ncbi:MAG TPA: hypothetical protein PKC72_05895 [Chitinophagaceae bacterium]|nr:hypothetical protein [Chitinophagaceae bacterium]
MLRSFFLFSLYLFPIFLYSQEKDEKSNVPAGQKYMTSFGVSLPLGDFSSTHFLGFNAEFSISNQRFGQMKKVPVKRMALIASGGSEFFLGKKEKVVTSSYKYPVYIVPYINGGIILNPFKEFSFSFIAGPALALYNSTTRFSLRAALQGNYFITKTISTGIRLSMTKESISEPLWYGSLIVGYVF